jgi:hypothetical protein
MFGDFDLFILDKDWMGLYYTKAEELCFLLVGIFQLKLSLLNYCHSDCHFGELPFFLGNLSCDSQKAMGVM